MSESKRVFPVVAPESGQIIDGFPSSAVAFVMESGFTYRKPQLGELALPGSVLERMMDVDASLQNSAARSRSLALLGSGAEALK